MTGPDYSDEETQENIVAVVQGIERFVAAGQNTEASDLLDQLIPVIAHGIDFVENADEIGLFSGLALACARLSRLDDTQNYARRAIIENPDDLLAHALLAPEARISVARQLIRHQRHDLARDLLKTMGMTGQSNEGEFYLELLDFYDTQKALARRLPSQPYRDEQRPTLLNLVVWDEEHIEKCLKYAIPSLLAPGNIPDLASESGVIVDIYTSEDGRTLIEDDPAFGALAKFAEIRFTEIPDTLLRYERTESTPDPENWCVAGAQYTAAVAARHLDADIAFIGVDNIYSDSCLSGAKAFIEAGHSGVLTNAIRAQEAPMDDYLKEEIPGAGSPDIEIDSAQLLAYATQNIDRRYFDLFIDSDATQADQEPVAVFFATEDGFAAHSFRLTPVMISSDLLPDDVVFDFHTAEKRFMAEIINGRDPEALIKVVEEPNGDIAVIELDAEDAEKVRNIRQFPVTTETCAKAGLEWCFKESDIPYCLWAIRQRFTVPCGDYGLELPESDMDEERTVEEVLDRFEAGVQETVQRIRFYNGAYR